MRECFAPRMSIIRIRKKDIEETNFPATRLTKKNKKFAIHEVTRICSFRYSCYWCCSRGKLYYKFRHDYIHTAFIQEHTKLSLLVKLQLQSTYTHLFPTTVSITNIDLIAKFLVTRIRMRKMKSKTSHIQCLYGFC